MAVRRDIKIDSTGALEIANGDFVIWESDAQHIDLAVKTSKGQWKQWPLFGVGAADDLNSSGGINSLRRRIITTCESDQYTKVKAEVFEGEIYVNAKYKGDEN